MPSATVCIRRLSQFDP